MRHFLIILLFQLSVGIYAQPPSNFFIITFDGKQNGSITRDKALSIDSLDIFINPKLSKANVKIVGFKISAVISGFSDYGSTSISNQVTKAQKSVLKKVGLNHNVYIENIIINYNGTTFRWDGSLIFKIIGNSLCLLRYPKDSCNNNEFHPNELIEGFDYVTTFELIETDKLIISRPNRGCSPYSIDGSLVISSFSCRIEKYYIETIENSNENYYHICFDTTFLINSNILSNNLKLFFSYLCNHDKVTFSDIVAINKEGIKEEIAPLTVIIIE